ncbi:MAG TPA: PKD domain-containing protein [Caldimonas sp.]|nr:PKD domain-containing protein [Caldimonas sp.]
MLALSACGGGGSSGGGDNRAPTANFAFSCADLVCTFTSNSTDQDVGDAVVGLNWNFGDATAATTAPAPVHTFAAAGGYDVNLTVADRSGATNSIVRRVTVTAGAAPAAPHASFTVNCLSLACTFTDTSTFDTPGSGFAARSWDFGDSTAPVTTTPTIHTYGATTLTTYTARLTVTDINGKTSTSVQSVVVAPPATSLNCVGGNCTLTLTQASKVSAGLVSHSCAAQGNRVVLTAPINEVIFADGCINPVGSAVTLNGGAAFAANTQLQFAVLSGTVPSTSLAFQPSIRVAGDFASGWTLTFDDGFGGPGEPDFNDMVILIKATGP